MYSQAAQAYGTANRKTLTGRELEANVLLKAATQLKRLQDNFSNATEQQIEDVLVYNRKLWTIFATAVSDEQSELPVEVRQNIASLAVFIFKHTLETSIRPEAGKLNVLININREIAAGLRGSVPAETYGEIDLDDEDQTQRANELMRTGL